MVADVIFLTLYVLSPVIEGSESGRLALTLLAFPIVYLTLGSYLYRRLGGRPLRLPPCPHCQERVGYLQPEFVMDRATQVCVECGGTFELWYSRPPEEYQAGSCPELLSAFPQVIGRYQLLSAGRLGPEIRTVFPETTDLALLSAKEVADASELVAYLQKQACSPELIEEMPEGVYPDQYFSIHGSEGAILVETTLTTDRATNGRNLWRLHKLGRWMVERCGRIEVYAPQSEEVIVVLE